MSKDYRLIIETPQNEPKDGRAWRAQWRIPGLIPEGRQSDPFDFTPPLQKKHLEELRWYLEEFIQFPGAGDRVRAGKLEKNLMEWGRMLFHAAFAGSAGKRIADSLMDSARGGGSTTLTIASTEAAILAQPWELMRNADELLTFRGVTPRRQLPDTRRIPRYEFQPPLRILLIVARPKDAGFIDPRNSIRPILDALESLRGQVEVDFCEPPTLSELERSLEVARQADKPYHIVHFDGHGTMMKTDSGTEVGALRFENDIGMTDPVPGLTLGEPLFENHIPVVILESCRGAYPSDEPAYTSVAPALLQRGVASIVAFSHSVHVEAARILVARFYRELVAGASVGRAVDKAREALCEYPARVLSRGPDAETIDLADWFIPQLYQAGDDPVLLPHYSAARNDVASLRGAKKNDEPAWKRWMRALVPVGWASPRVPINPSMMGTAPSADASDAFAHPSLAGFPPSPKYYFHGRAPELLKLERAFRQHPAVLLHAMGGMGKTALAREAAHWWRRKGTIQTAVFHSFERLAGAERVAQVLGQAFTGGQGGDAGGNNFSAEFNSLSADEQWRRAVELFHQQPVLLVWDNFESTLARFAEPPPGIAALQSGSSKNADSVAELGLGDPGGDDAITGFSDESREDLLRLYHDLTTPKDGQRPKGKLLITCRPGKTFLPVPDGAKVELEGLAPPDALYLLRAVMREKRMDPERHERFEIDSLLKMLAWQPLAIELVTPHLANLAPEEIRDEFAQYLGRFTDPNHPEARNRSLLASLGFSVRRLSPATRKVLPLLGWFRGGVFERFLLAFTELEAADWAPIRAELTATALIRVEEVGFDTPYLVFHPTLPFAQSGEAARATELGERFLAVYLAVMGAIDDGLRGQEPAAGMALAGREEGNLRRALVLAFQDGKHREGAQLADTLRLYLDRTGRLRERDVLAAYIRERLPDAKLGEMDEATWVVALQHAWGLFEQGREPEALEQVEGLLARLQRSGADPFQLAMTQLYLGRIHDEAGQSGLALAPLRAAMAGFEALGEEQRGNLAAALGDLANAYRNLGRLEEALAASERGLAIGGELGRTRDVAAGLGRTAAILQDAQRWPEAEARYREALATVRRVEDAELEGAFLQHLGDLYREQGRYPEARRHLQQAISRFQATGDQGSEMRTCDLLASAERDQSRLDEAEGWYLRARELAGQRRDHRQLAAIAQNLGILYQTQAEQASDPAARGEWLGKAVASVREGLDGFLAMGNQLGAAASYFQLGVLYRLSGDIEAAEENARRALAIREPLDHPDVYKDYWSLMNITHARGDEPAAGEWQAKRDAKLAEVERLRAGG
uniref:Tetratricopeptide repeat-containing protein n=1 Tax=Candidatus Kentrum sp. SD TaxID=2126332 RepID=A0A451BQ86_9GAMM|nr:MAG: Tetratricopeptide repeat-containing protein [Candidatus Kentron sp. SD]VFK46715.1 MAG: Tetratricopeptide repeat-containing protein [Candidatus Kentron sp. SD]VFK80456.1 MAG: Tetratricopeptide repeat-containing protein [Candidatus Kentron sp. SD]